jgi:general secretion pathway protein N
MLKVRTLIIVALVSYLLSLLVTVPASLIWRQLESRIQIQGLEISSVQGQLWQGSAVVNWRQQNAQVNWSLNGWPLLIGRLAGDVNIKAAGLDVASDLSVGLSEFQLESVSGYIDEVWINPELRRNRVAVSGRLWLEQLIVTGEWQTLITQAEGELRWTGGEVSYPVGRAIHSPDIAPLSARVSSNEKGIQLVVSDADQTQVLSGLLDTQGWGTLTVYKHLLALAGEPWPEGGRDIVLDLKQKVF